MNYLFYDIECCDGYNLCSFGYIIVDENFNTIVKEDIVVNPQKKFKIARKGFDPNKELAYKEEYFKKQPTFDHYYNKIKELLTNKNTTIISFSSKSDINYLANACKKYNLKIINYKTYDAQKIYSIATNTTNECSLKNIIKKMNLENNALHEHKSCDDAEMTMLVIKELCKKYNKNINSLLKLSNTFKFEKKIKRKNFKKL